MIGSSGRMGWFQPSSMAHQIPVSTLQQPYWQSLPSRGPSLREALIKHARIWIHAYMRFANRIMRSFGVSRNGQEALWHFSHWSISTLWEGSTVWWEWFKWCIAPEVLVRIVGRHAAAVITLYTGLWLYRSLCKGIAWIKKTLVRLCGGQQLALASQKQAECNEAMENATSYQEWKRAAEELDRLEGKWEWKQRDDSPLYDCYMIRKNINQLQTVLDTHDPQEIIFFLRSRLRRNLHGIDNNKMYINLRVGTKDLIEKYIDEVCRGLQMVCSLQSPGLTDARKLTFFNECRHAYGRSALLLSGGGATFGLYHGGVLKALVDNNALPRIIAGSSVGSIMASFIGSSNDEELHTFLNEPQQVNKQFFDLEHSPESRWTRIHRFLTKGVFMEISHLQWCLRDNIGDLTFQEAFDRTGRILNIAVSPATDNFSGPRLLNYLTAPNVLLWSAASASSAIPLVFEPVQLMAKDSDGYIVPYHTKGVKWVDGSFKSDLPMKRIRELFNVNHFIVSQVNPHVVPVMYASEPDAEGTIPDLIRLILTQISTTLTNILQFPMPSVISRPLSLIRYILNQQYRGDVTIIPKTISWQDYRYIISNPTTERYERYIKLMEKTTWETLPTILGHTQIEFTIDECLRRMRGRVRAAGGRIGSRSDLKSRVMSFCAPNRSRFSRGSLVNLISQGQNQGSSLGDDKRKQSNYGSRGSGASPAHQVPGRIHSSSSLKTLNPDFTSPEPPSKSIYFGDDGSDGLDTNVQMTLNMHTPLLQHKVRNMTEAYFKQQQLNRQEEPFETDGTDEEPPLNRTASLDTGVTSPHGYRGTSRSTRHQSGTSQRKSEKKKRSSSNVDTHNSNDPLARSHSLRHLVQPSSQKRLRTRRMSLVELQEAANLANPPLDSNETQQSLALPRNISLMELDDDGVMAVP